jgi:predicted permease
MAVALVVGAGLLLRTVRNLSRVNAGFDRSHLVTFGISLPLVKYAAADSRQSFYLRLIDQLTATPGVLRVAAMTGLPPLRPVNANTTDIEGFVDRPNGPSRDIDYYQRVTAGYFDVLGIPLLEGRAFEPSDGAIVAIVNQTTARTFWPGQSAVGHRVRPGPNVPWSTIVGVVGDVKQGGVDKKTGTELYFPVSARVFPNTMNLVMRTPLDAAALSGTIQRVIASLDPSLPVIRLRNMGEVFDESIGRPRLVAELLTIFAGLALLLSVVGTYAVLSYMVSERRREIGVRMALGATPGSVLAMVIGHGARLTLAGLSIGIALALAGGRALSSLLFGVSPADPPTVAAVVALIGGAALAACYVPGRLATRVDPLVALRDE